MIAGGALTQGELERWGRAIGAAARPPLFLALDGPLGAGKSVLARSIARGAGVTGSVPSPTYTLVQSYELGGGRRLVHMDLYRLGHSDEVIELGWDDLVSDAEALVVVEWAARAGEHLPDDRWAISLDPVEGAPELRHLEVRAIGAPGPLPARDEVGR